MSDNRSPIERMIDEAVGYDPASKRDAPIKLECPHCGAEKMAARDKSDPPNTYIVRVACPDCTGDGDRPIVDYFDKLGRQLDLDGNLISSEHVRQQR